MGRKQNPARHHCHIVELVVVIQGKVMSVVGGKFGQGLRKGRIFAEDADIEADANHVELYMEGRFFKGAAMLLEEIARHRDFPSSGAAGTWTGNTALIPASQQGHNCNQVERRFYP